MEDVLVPVENLLGTENGGFMCIMYNFNHERWFIVVYILSVTRAVIEECFRWCMQRRTFGKKLMDQPVIRMKMAAMIGALEPCSHWLDSITYQMCNMEYSMQALRLAGTTSLLKYQSTRAAHLVADNAVQVFGGRGITKTGMGRMVERLNVGNKFAAILGGSEEIMADLSMKLAMGAYPANARL
jgi:alkylation response protein AidB-like acyl-CoA dehydrogenase